MAMMTEAVTVLPEIRGDDMADKVDALFKDYFSGIIDANIKIIKLELSVTGNTDENVGGGRAQNKQNNAVESKMIREQSDRELRFLEHEKFIVSQFVGTLDQDNTNMLIWHYNRNSYHSWLQIASLLKVDESVCRKRLRKIKEEFRESYFGRLVDNV